MDGGGGVKIGDHVVVRGLLAGVELNGCSGVVEAWLPNSETKADDGGRWRVRVGGRSVALKPCNLRRLVE